MRQSILFTKIRKEGPKEEDSLNASLLIQAGFIHKEISGVYSFLPLGFRVLNKISNIIRDELNKINCQEILMSALQDPIIWKNSDRWHDDNVDIWFKTKLKSGGDLGLGFTHEEPINRMVKNHIFSYKDLPFYPYQIQTKFRNEFRAKNGLLRGREFLMKDLYSFSKNKTEHQEFYNRIIDVYHKIYQRLGIGDITYLTFASGGTFSQFSHEFQTICSAGEDIIYLDEKKKIAINKEVYNQETLDNLGLSKENLKEVRATEVGNIFTLGTKFSETADFKYLGSDGKNYYPFSGSYGIGVSRILALIVEIFSDNKGIVWPESIAPFRVHLISLNQDREAEEIYKILLENNIEVLFDDRDIPSAEKLGSSDIMGIPIRILISEKSLSQGGLEIKRRTEKEAKIFSKKDFLSVL